LSSAKRIVKRFLQAVRECDHKDCEIELPENDELEALAEEWNKLSTAGGSMNGCVLVIDGFLSPRTKPDVDDPNEFFTDRKSIYCLNVITAVDFLGRFQYIRLLESNRFQ
jgi:hypothetical protein